MVTLRTPGTVVARDLILATDVTNIVGCILGTAGYGQQIAMVALEDSTNYANTLGNKDTTNGRAVKIQYGDHAGTPTTLATFAKAAITLNLPATIKHADLADPAAGYTSIGARASDGQVVARISGGSQVLLASASDSPSTILTTTGDTLYASSGGVAARLAIGTTHHVMTVAGGVPSWAAGSKATLTTTGDTLYASSANTLARLAVGSTNQMLSVTGGVPAWKASTTSTLTTTGDTVYASSANTLARLAIGSTNQMLSVTGGVPAWKASSTSVLTTTGDMLYASSANTLARLGVGSDGHVLTLSSGLPTWAAAASSTVANKNRVINGEFRLNQRVTSATADNAYGLDRWRLLLGASNAAILSQETSDLPTGGSRNAATLTVGSGNNNKFGIFQILEGKDIWDMRGGTSSISFQMKATAGITDVRAAIVQWTGTEDNGGSAFADPINVWGATATVPTYTGSWANANTPANLTPTTSWASYSIAGVTISSSATNLAVFIWSEDTTTTTTTDILRITDVQLEKSSTATPFERRHINTEYPLAARFFVKTFPLATAPAQNSGTRNGSLVYNAYAASTAGPASVQWRFPVPMRAAPTLTFYSPSNASANWWNASAGTVSGTPAAFETTEFSVSVNNPQVVGDSATQQINVHASALAEL